MRPHTACLALVLAALVGCATGARHPALDASAMPRLLPVRAFVANTDAIHSFRVSPDGRRLAWIGVDGLRSAIRWRSLASPDAPVHSVRFRKNAPRPFWAADSRHLLYQFDPSGRENEHVFAIDTDAPDRAPRDLTPYPGVKAFVQHVPAAASSRIFVGHNQQDPSYFDFYEIDLASGARTPLGFSSDNIVGTLLDDAGRLRARVRQTDRDRILEVPESDGWRTLLKGTRFDVLYPLNVTPDGSQLRIVSNLGRDRTALYEVDLASGSSMLLHEEADIDLGRVVFSPRDRRPLATYSSPGHPRAHYFDARLERLMAALTPPRPAGVTLRSIDREERVATVSIYDDSGASFYLTDLERGETTQLGESSSRKHANVLARMQPFTFEARDGMRLNGLVTRPRIASEAPLPTVVLVHGGPWWRDYWEYDDEVQFLANRGYVVLQVNYRGSTGFGRAYLHAAEGQFARAMHDDLLDAVSWAADQRMTDPARVAIMGASYGGYATLVGMTMTPDVFRCGIDVVGVSDLASLVENAPPYWKSSLHYWHRFVGDPSAPAQRAEMDARSPLNHARHASGPLLIVHGRNDPRVHIDQSERMVEALRAAAKPVRYVVFDDEGHGLRHWKHQMKLFRETEDFLAGCLGGRSGGFDFYQLGAWAF